ncbi:Putative transporter [Clostridium neonatale]|nr:Putative transporter [Clostridium neonatale]
MLESLRKNSKGILLMLISSICVCVGQLLWKISAEEGILFLIFGFALYGIGAFIMIIAYKFGSLSVLQPMLSLNYVLSIILAHTILKEDITLLKVIGVLIIILGVILIGGGISNMLYYILLVIMTLIGAFASLFLKKASYFKNFRELIWNINLYIGGILYFVSAVVNIYILHFLDYSIVLPLTSITYIWTMIIAYLVFEEKITKKKIAGLSLILIGVITISMV